MVHRQLTEGQTAHLISLRYSESGW